MSRHLILAVLLAVSGLAFAQPKKPGGQDAPEGGNLEGSATEDAVCPKGRACPQIAWDEKSQDYGVFFRYQRYLVKIGAPAETEADWKKVAAEEQRVRINKASAFIKKRFADLARQGYYSPDDIDFLKIVWGDEVAAGFAKIAQARRLENVDDATRDKMIRKATEEVGRLAKKVGGINLDLDSLFDASGKKKGGLDDWLDSPLVDLSDDEDASYVKQKKRSPFLDSLSSPETQKVLETRKSFKDFLKKKEVAPQALPGLLAMYEVLTGAPSAEREELAHILPTVVRFLNDGKSIALEPHEGALGVAIPGEYDQPEKVAVTPAAQKADPIVVGKTLAHEFQHIYDMYTGRYYTIDSEMRGFKVAARYFEALKKSSPEDYAALRNSDNDSTRGIIADTERYTAALEKGEQPFFEAVAFGHGYNQWHEGVFMGRMPLREAVDPRLGAPRELAARRAEIDQLKLVVAELETRQNELRAQRVKKNSRELDKEFDKVTQDLAGMRMHVASLEAKTDLQEIRVRRMQSNVEWLDKRSLGKTPPQFDMNLTVDKEYMVP